MNFQKTRMKLILLALVFSLSGNVYSQNNNMSILEDDFKAVFKAALFDGHTLDQLRSIVIEFRDSGGDQKVAEMALSDIVHSGYEEKYDDLTREVLDFVTGFCIKEMRIWPE